MTTKLSAPADWTSPRNLTQHAIKHGPRYDFTEAEYDALATELLKQLTKLRQLKNVRPRPANKHTDGENVIVTTPEGKIITMYKTAAQEIRNYVKTAGMFDLTAPHELKVPVKLFGFNTHLTSRGRGLTPLGGTLALALALLATPHVTKKLHGYLNPAAAGSAESSTESSGMQRLPISAIKKILSAAGAQGQAITAAGLNPMGMSIPIAFPGQI